MSRRPMTVYTSILALLIGLTLGTIFSDEILALFRGDPDNIYILENGKYSYPIGPGTDTLLVPVDFPADSTGQPITFTVDPARTGPLFFTTNPGSGFADAMVTDPSEILAPTVTFTEGEMTVNYVEPLNAHGVELTCKVDVAGGGTCRLVPRGTHWEVEW